MGYQKCKVCLSNCYKNRKFERFLSIDGRCNEVITCATCRTSFLLGDPPTDIYDSSYFSVVGDDYNYEEQSVSNLDHYGSILTGIVEKLEQCGKLADIGCGKGHFVNAARCYFKEVVGFDGFIDPNEFVAGSERLQICDIEKIVLKPLSYDAITLNHSLEHVNNPHYIIGQCYDALKVGGVLYVEVPLQYISFYDRVLSWFKPKEIADIFSYHHKCFFTPKSLERLLVSRGFEVLKKETFLPLRSQTRFLGGKGKLLYIFLKLSSFFERGDFIAIFAKKGADL